MNKLDTIPEEENVKYRVADEDNAEDIDNIKIKPSIQENKSDVFTMEEKISQFKILCM